jgi:hypothetical protein
MAGHNHEPFVQEHTMLLGRLDAKTSAIQMTQTEQTALLESIDNRLRTVEVRSARNGLIAGLGATVLVEMVKSKLGLGS